MASRRQRPPAPPPAPPARNGCHARPDAILLRCVMVGIQPRPVAIVKATGLSRSTVYRLLKGDVMDFHSMVEVCRVLKAEPGLLFVLGPGEAPVVAMLMAGDQ